MSSTPLKLMSSMATRDVVGELAAHHALATGQAVTCEAAGGVDVAKRVRSGERVDVVILASAAIDALTADGALLAGSRVDLMRSGVAVAVRAGAPKPDISAQAGVKAAVMAAETLSYSTGPSGVYLESLFERWGILERIRSRIVVPPPGVPVGSLVASGAAELGFQQAAELRSIAGIDMVGPLPSDIQLVTIFSGGIATRCGNTEAARTLLQYLASPAASSVKRSHGMEPA